MLTAPSTTGATEKLAYSIEEAAQLLGISKTSAYQASQRGEIPTVVIGRRRLVPKSALERLLAGDTATPPAAPSPRRTAAA